MFCRYVKDEKTFPSTAKFSMSAHYRLRNTFSILLQFLVRFGTQVNQITLKSHKDIIPIAELISKPI